MALQLRRGAYEDFDPDKMVAAEVAVVTEGDPNSASGRSIYMCFEPGVVKRLADYEDILDLFEDAEDEALQEAIARLEESVETIVDHVEDIQEDVDEKATLSESYARGGTGTRTGEDTDNAKYYAEQAAEIVGFTPESTYPFLTAGQLLSTHETTDNTPYNYRVVEQESTLEYGDIIGGTVAWNQLRADSYTSTNADGITTSYSDGQFSITNVSRTTNFNTGATYNIVAGTTAIAGHKYLVCAGSVKNLTGVCIILPVAGMQTIPVNSLFVTPSSGLNMYLRITNAYDFVTTHPIGDVTKFSMNIFDLTQMLGTTIADYIYSLESATAGAGVTWLRMHFPKVFQYHAYDAGSLQSVEGLSHHVTTGFNQWDEQWELGGISTSTGLPVANDTIIRSKNFIPVIPGTVYCLNFAKWMYMPAYDANKNYIGQLSYSRITGTDFYLINVSDEAHYVKIPFSNAYGTTYHNDVCLNFHGDRDGQYEPYKGHSYPLDSTKTFRGIFKLDSSNRLYADGDRYLPDGTVQRRYGIVDLGTLTWTMFSTAGWFWADVTDSKNKQNVVKANAVCSCYIVLPVTSSGSDPNVDNTDKTLAVGFNNLSRLYLHDSAYTDAATFKTAMSGVYLVYELATPTTESADPYTNPQIVAPGGTEEYISTSVVPVGHESRYPDDLRAKLDALPWDLSMIAPIENGTTASQAYAVGKYFLHNNQFCKAKTAIASGATLTLNTNYEVTTIADELYSALH